MKIHHYRGYEMWYDKKLWWAALHDSEGNQIGEALVASNRLLLQFYVDLEFNNKQEKEMV